MNSSESIATAITQQFPRQVQFLQRLVQAKSVNPFLPDHSLPDVPIEGEVAAVIQDELDALGLWAYWACARQAHNYQKWKHYVFS